MPSSSGGGEPSAGDGTCAPVDIPMMTGIILILIIFLCAVVVGVRLFSSLLISRGNPFQVKLDNHLLGSSSSPTTLEISRLSSATLVGEQQQQPCYFPVLNDTLVANILRSEQVASVALERIIKEQLEGKLQNTLSNFFQPLITGFREGNYCPIHLN